MSSSHRRSNLSANYCVSGTDRTIATPRPLPRVPAKVLALGSRECLSDFLKSAACKKRPTFHVYLRSEFLTQKGTGGYEAAVGRGTHRKRAASSFACSAWSHGDQDGPLHSDERGDSTSRGSAAARGAGQLMSWEGCLLNRAWLEIAPVAAQRRVMISLSAARIGFRNLRARGRRESSNPCDSKR